ncbi:MAG: hypothetical protein PGN25_14060 [Methylorubrum populi]
MRIVPTLAAGFALGAVGATPVCAAPALPQPSLVAPRTVETVDWHPSTRHWDHHFHAHQPSLRYHQPTEAERRIHRSMRRPAPHALGAERSGSYGRLGPTTGIRRF